MALATCALTLPAIAAAADTTVATTDIAELTLVAARDKLRRKEFPAALALFGSAAAAGSAEGQYQYAQMLRNAQGTLAGADLKGACGWLEKAALQGHARAGLALAGLLDENQCQSATPAATWRERASQGGVLPPASTATVERNDPAMRKTLAFRAALAGDTAALQPLLAADNSLATAIDAAGRTVLHAAVESGKADTVEAALAVGTPVAAEDAQHYTALALAARNGCLPCLQTLLRAQSPLDVVNIDGDTALLVAVAAGRAPPVAALLAAGADASHRNGLG